MLTFITSLSYIKEPFGSDLITNLLGAILFLLIYEKLFKNSFSYYKNWKFRGRYIHCDMDFIKISTNGSKHYSNISINFFMPSILNIESYDFTDGKNRKWSGKIKVNVETGLYAFGTYKYENENLAGIHDILIIDEETLCFQLSYFKKTGQPYLMVKEGSEKIKISTNN